MFDDVQLIVKTYTRAFVSQSIGIIGLLWCLYDNHLGFGVLLTLLVLADQAIFLRTRFARENRGFPFQTALNVWCLFVSAVDILVLFAILYQAVGLHDAHAAPVTDPLDFLAFSVATFARLGSDLTVPTGAGRLLAACQALMSDAVLVGFAVAVLLALRER